MGTFCHDDDDDGAGWCWAALLTVKSYITSKSLSRFCSKAPLRLASLYIHCRCFFLDKPLLVFLVMPLRRRSDRNCCFVIGDWFQILKLWSDDEWMIVHLHLIFYIYSNKGLYVNIEITFFFLQYRPRLPKVNVDLSSAFASKRILILGNKILNFEREKVGTYQPTKVLT